MPRFLFPRHTSFLAAIVTEASDHSLSARITSPMMRIPETGDRLLANCWDGKALFFFFVKVVKVSDLDVELSLPANGIEVQRRTSSRVEATIPFGGLVTSAKRSELVGEIIRDVETQDIGVQGLRFETQLELEIGDTLFLQLDLSKGHKVEGHGWVVWTEQKQRNGKPLYSIGVSFLQWGPEEQMQLLQFLGRHQTSDRRAFARWETSLPCTVAWGEQQVEGEISNISVDGALITGVRAVPAEKDRVIVTIPLDQDKVILVSKVTSRIVHTAWKTVDEEEIGLFGVDFTEDPGVLQQNLAPVLRSLFSKGRQMSRFEF